MQFRQSSKGCKMDRRKKFSQRLSELRIEKGVSSRDMSLSLGLSPAYINNIENNVSMPHDFFDFERRPSQALLELFRKEESLTQMQVELIIMKKGAVALTENNR